MLRLLLADHPPGPRRHPVRQPADARHISLVALQQCEAGLLGHDTTYIHCTTLNDTELQMAEEIKRVNNVQVLAVPMDITDMEAVKAAAAATAQRFGVVHIVVNNVHNRVRRPGSQLTWAEILVDGGYSVNAR